jgi:low affinity Fe/Cu permease
MERSEAASSREQKDGRSWFERFVEQAQQIVSRAPFFFVCVCIIVAWAVSLPLFGDTGTWMAVIHTVSSVLALLLLVLLENSGRRAEEAAQEKLNVLAEGLSDLMESQARNDPQLQDAVKRLRDAVGLEERH